MMTSRFGLQCSDSEHSAIILCIYAGATMCSDDYKLHTSPHTHVQIGEHDDLESIMSSYVYGLIDYDS